jgi:Coenzyme PQQ synthesis protein D (PqqD)
LDEVRCEYRISLMRRSECKKSDCFPNKFENHWRLHCSKCQGVRHALRTTDCAKWGEPMYRVSDGVRSTHGQDGAIVLDVQQGQMFNLNRVGSRILELLESGSAEPDIVTVISSEFNVSQDVVENDVREFIESLRKHRLVLDR